MYSKKKIQEGHIKLKILRWYKYNARKLPWRSKKNNNLPKPYFVFVSEFILQQTTVNAAVPKFNEFVYKWPNLDKFSKIKEKTVLKFWAGLGYYNRARNILKSSKIISKFYGGIIPSSYDDLIKLPGVGDYTAKAIQGIAFNKQVMPIDANIKRIIERIYCIISPLKNKEAKIYKHAQKLISKKKSSDFIQALMDYGSKICLPKSPNCKICVISNHCLGYKKNKINIIPYKINNKSIIIKYTRAYIIFNEFDEILVRYRSSSGMLPAMLEIPNDKWVYEKRKLKKEIIIRNIKSKLIKLEKNIIYSFSHFNLNIDIYYCKINKRYLSDLKWLPLSKYNNSGMPTVMKKVIKEYLNLI